MFSCKKQKISSSNDPSFTSNRKEDADLARMDLWRSWAVNDDADDDEDVAEVVEGGCVGGCGCGGGASGINVVSGWAMTLVMVNSLGLGPQSVSHADFYSSAITSITFCRGVAVTQSPCHAGTQAWCPRRNPLASFEANEQP